jgi:hypothetical protein
MDLGLTAYRTKIDEYIGKEYAEDKSTDYLDKSLDFLYDLLNENFKDKKISKLLIGSTFVKDVNRSYYIRRKVSSHEISKKLQSSSISYIDSACLTTFSAIDFMKDIDNQSISVFVGFEDLNIDPVSLKNISLDSPDEKFDTPWIISEELHYKKDLLNTDYADYIRKCRQSVNKSKNNDAYTYFIYGKGKSNDPSSEEVLNIPRIDIDSRGSSLPFARLSRGATIVVLTYDKDIVDELGGLVVRGVGCSSGIGNPTDINPFLTSIEKALTDAGISIAKVDYYEIFDSYLTATIALIKNIGISVDNINPYGNSLIRGDTTSAAGGLTLCNTEAAFKDCSDYSSGLLVQYSFPSVISVVVESLS